MALVSGYHHLTMSTHGVQEDYDFYTRALGLYSVKRTVLFDGVLPVYHLYYGSRHGDASTIITTFPFKKPGIFGRRGTNQSRSSSRPPARVARSRACPPNTSATSRMPRA